MTIISLFCFSIQDTLGDPTLELTFAASLIIIFVSIPLGVFCAINLIGDFRRDVFNPRLYKG